MEKPSLKIAFAGTTEFSATHLQVLLNEGFAICAVLTREDKPAGRGQKLTQSPVKILALQHHLPVYQPKTLKDSDAYDLIKNIEADIIVDVAYGLIIPKTILEIPRLGFLNVHPSLLPKWRGPAPIQHTILAGDQETGVTIMQLDEGVDTGPILLQKTYRIQPNETAESLTENLVKLGCNALVTVLRELQETEILNLQAQSNEGISYAPKIDKTMGRINWKKPAAELARKIRAYNPTPVAFSEIGGEVVRIWQATQLSNYVSDEPGTIIRLDKNGIDVATGDGILRIQQLQFSGGKVLSAEEALNGKKTFFEKHSSFR